MLAPGVVATPEVAFWARALRFAGSLVARGRFLPGIEVREGLGLARWEPVLTDRDAAEAARLAGAMPPAARALVGGRGARERSGDDGHAAGPRARAGAAAGRRDGPGPGDGRGAPEASPAAVLRRFLRAMTDHLVRSSRYERAILPVAGQDGLPGLPPVLHDRWLRALVSPDPVLRGEPEELEELAARLAAWRRPLEAEGAFPFRLCFRLEEPAVEAAVEAAAPWRLEYLLQAHDDPSLRLPLARAWAPEEEEEAALRRYGRPSREQLLSSLGRAARLSQAVETSLSQPEPAGVELDTTGAHRFLRREAPELEEAGFGLLLPAWWTRGARRLRVGLRARAEDPGSPGAGLSLDDLVRVRWDLALGDEPVSREELEALAALKVPLVRVRGRWVEVDADELRAALRRWERMGEEELGVRDLLRAALGVGAPPEGFELAGVEATGRVGALLERLGDGARLEPRPPPAAFVGELRPYQARGYAWLAFLGRFGLGACLADDMGLGKTVQALAAVARAREEDGAGPVLVVCPTSVVTNWRKEAERFTPALPVLVHHGPDRPRGDAFREAARERALVLTNYALLHRDHEELASVEWAGVVLDEAQHIKNPATHRARVARSLPTGFRIALTGTPVENHVGDLWSIMEFLNPGLLGSRAEFRRRFLIPIQARRDPGALARLRRATGPFLLRRVKSDPSVIGDLPEKLETKRYCTLTREQASLYAAVLREMEEGLAGGEDGMGRRGLILATLTRLKQVCNHPAHFLGDGSPIPGRSGKLERLGELLAQVLEMGERALVFTQFTAMGALLQRHLQETFGREALFLHGGVPRGRRDEMVDRFQGERGPSVFLLSLRAGGTGLNLTRANHVFHFDRWWNPAVEGQATDRAHRIGQRRDVQVHKLICAGTLEERIDEMIEGKEEVARRAVGTGEAWLTELSDRELRDVLALRPGSVEE